MSAGKSLLSVGVGLAAATAAGAVGFATDRLIRDRNAAIGLGTDVADLSVVPDEERVVVAEDGVPLHVEIDQPSAQDLVAGGPIVVLTHGYTHSLQLWSYQRRALKAAGYRVVVWDMRGHGRSEEGEDSAYTIAQIGRDLGRVVDETTGAEPVVLVGHSMGGMAMMSLADQRPDLFQDKVIGAGFISTSSGDLRSVDLGLGKQLGSVVHRLGPGAMAQLGERQGVVDGAVKVGRDVERFFVDRYSFASPVSMAIVQWTADMIFHTRMNVMSAFFADLANHNGLESLATYNGIETLVMHGAQDRITPRQHGDAIVDAVPGCEYIVVERAGHVLPLEYPDLVSSEVLGLVERASRSHERPSKRTVARVRTMTSRGRRGRSRKVS